MNLFHKIRTYLSKNGKKAGIAVFCAAVLLGAANCRSIYLQKSVAGKILRFHVLANSDSNQDQELKLKVRDEIGKYLHEELKDADNLTECMAVVEKDKQKIEACAKEVIAEEGYDYSVRASIGDVDFPVKTYGSYTFPAGTYKALELEIGSGKGQNWWCVMYPNMCFSNSIYEVVDENAREELQKVLTQEEYEKIMEEGNYKVKSKYLEKLKEILNLGSE